MIGFSDNGGDTHYRLTLRNGVLACRGLPAGNTATASMPVTKMRMLQLPGSDTHPPGLDITGEAFALITFMGVLDTGDPGFNIVAP